MGVSCSTATLAVAAKVVEAVAQALTKRCRWRLDLPLCLLNLLLCGQSHRPNDHGWLQLQFLVAALSEMAMPVLENLA